MSPNPGPSVGVAEYGERLSLETSILRTLCLTINSTGSELKYKIIDTLSEDDFFFPVNKSIFSVLEEMHRRGDYVVYTNLEEEMRRQSVDVPEDLYVEDFFKGSLPELSELGKWVTRLKEWSRTPLIEPGPPPKENPPKAVAPASTPEPEKMRVLAASKSQPIVRKAEKTPPPVVRRAAAPPKTERAPGMELSSEGDEWGEYLDELASQQGKVFETGFVGIDQGAGGISTGVMLLVDQESERRIAFLKQLTDQIAAKTKVPCLFVSHDTPKATLRVFTLSRLSGVAARDIERGRLRKDSPEWKNVEANGRKAAAWLKRVFVVEARDNTGIETVRSLGRKLVDGTEESTGVIVIDNMDKLGIGSGERSLVSELKQLSDSLDVLVVAATVNRKLLADPDADYVAEIAGGDTGVRLELTASGESEPRTIRFKYQPAIQSFSEQ